MGKEVLLVNLNDKPIKKMEKMEAHLVPTLHRAFSVFLINQNKILIQQRSKTKYHSPLLWANACCSHPVTNDIKEEISVRLKEELGINEKIEFSELFSFIYYANLGNVFEYEFDHVFVGNYNGKINPSKDEVENYEWIEIKELEKQLVKNPKKFAPWFLICAPKVINLLKKR